MIFPTLDLQQTIDNEAIDWSVEKKFLGL